MGDSKLVKTLVKKVNEIVDKEEQEAVDWIDITQGEKITKSEAIEWYSKGDAIELYDYVTRILFKNGEGMDDYTVACQGRYKKRLYVKRLNAERSVLNPSYENVCEAILGSKKIRPYLNLIWEI